MTKEEAIKILKKEMEGLVLILEKPLERNPSGTLEALDMAISALSENKGDLISKQAVLDELEKWDWQDLYLPIHFKQILDDVPSADIAECAKEIKKYCKERMKKPIWCNDCPLYEKVCFLFGNVRIPCKWDLSEGEKGGE